mmetsp:Transcript_23418/g.43095  ORF Transcript_23418/g.43095 Transcript_23418/m.43095 type:complete len:483 (+) Transcript_23418:53-1501(+)
MTLAAPSSQMSPFLRGEASATALRSLDDVALCNTARKVGSGNFSDVYLMQLKLPTSASVAIKVLQLSPTTEAKIRHEALVMSKLRDHPNVVKLLDVFYWPQRMAEAAGRGPPYVCIVMQPVLGAMPLSRFIMQESSLVKACPQILHQIAGALGYVHEHQVIHRDVWSDNVLFNKASGHAVLVDFGTAYLIGGMNPPELNEQLNILYASPQMGEGFTPQPSDDCWALGLLGTEVSTGKVFSHRLPSTTMPAYTFPEVIQQALDETFLKGGSVLGDICRQLLAMQAGARATSHDVVRQCAAYSAGGTVRFTAARPSTVNVPGPCGSPAAGMVTPAKSLPSTATGLKLSGGGMGLSNVSSAGSTTTGTFSTRSSSPATLPSASTVTLSPALTMPIVAPATTLSATALTVTAMSAATAAATTLAPSPVPKPRLSVGMQVMYQARSHQGKYMAEVLERCEREKLWKLRLPNGFVKEVPDTELWRIST